MKNILSAVILVFIGITFIGCKPDLTAVNLTITDCKKVKVTVKNIGNRDAGAFMVYINADENPVSPNYRPQISKSVQGLAKGAEIVFNEDFLPLANPANQNLANVKGYTVLVDPKSMVNESNENNNSITKLCE